MNTQLTVADVRASLSYIVNASNPNDPLFLSYLNRATQRVTNSGKWNGNMEEITIQATELNDSAVGFITLPRRQQSILGVSNRKVPAPTYSQWHQYIENGPGRLDPTWNYMGMLVDCGDGWPSQRIIPEGTSVTLRFQISNPLDANKTVRLFGIKDNKRIFSDDGEGVALITAFPFADTTQLFDKLTGVQKIQMIGDQSLHTVDGATVYQIGEYEPTETRPCYHRYQTNVIPEHETDRAFKILAQRRYVPLVAETDWVIPGNMEALEAALRAQQKADSYQQADALALWSEAYSVLNQETRAQRGAAKVPIENSSLFSNMGHAI
jgi:hypothetical protein